MPTNPKPQYLRFAGISLVAAAFILIGLPFVLHFFDEGAGGFTADKLNVLALAAMLLLACVHLAFFVYRRLFPGFYDYQRECLEGEGKLFENLTTNLEKDIYPNEAMKECSFAEGILLQAERRKTAQFKFTIRCVRFLFCFLVLAYLLYLAQHMLTVAMLAVPTASAPASLL